MSFKKIITVAVFFIVVVVLILLLARYGDPVKPNDKYFEADSGSVLVMGTFARAVAVCKTRECSQNCIEAALSEIRKVDELMSDYKSDSEISRVNRMAFEEPVHMSESTYQVLSRSKELSELTKGAFDITVGPLVDLWRSAEESNSLPSESQLEQARSKTGMDKLVLDDVERTVKFSVEGMRIDVGGVAKGYSIDKAVEAMLRLGAAGGMVDIGGDIRCFGRPREGRDSWLIGLQNPKEVTDSIVAGKPLAVLALTDVAVATSGNYRRYISIGDKKYSHIIDTRTGCTSGQPSDELASVTIIAENATRADALATAVSVMGEEDGIALIEHLPRTEALIIYSEPNNKFVQTSGMNEYLR